MAQLSWSALRGTSPGRLDICGYEFNSAVRICQEDFVDTAEQLRKTTRVARGDRYKLHEDTSLTLPQARNCEPGPRLLPTS
jgi:hypothetical protein